MVDIQKTHVDYLKESIIRCSTLLLVTSVNVKEGVTWEMELEGKATVGESFLE